MDGQDGHQRTGHKSCIQSNFDDGRNVASNLSQLISHRLIVALFPYFINNLEKMQNRENNDEMEQPLPLPPVAPRRQTGDSREVRESEF